MTDETKDKAEKAAEAARQARGQGKAAARNAARAAKNASEVLADEVADDVQDNVHKLHDTAEQAVKAASRINAKNIAWVALGVSAISAGVALGVIRKAERAALLATARKIAEAEATPQA